MDGVDKARRVGGCVGMRNDECEAQASLHVSQASISRVDQCGRERDGFGDFLPCIHSLEMRRMNGWMKSPIARIQTLAEISIGTITLESIATREK